MPSNGIVIGVVTDLKDDDNLARVRVNFPHLGTKSFHARLATPMAGPERGIFFKPEVGDEVLVGFLHGDIRFPYVLGSLWSTAHKHPAEVGDAEKNDIRLIKTKSGHLLIFDDSSGGEKIALIDKDGSRKVIIDSANSKIQVICDQGDVEVSASSGTVKADATTVEVTASGNTTIEATGNMTLRATGTMTIEGATININGTGPVSVAGTPIKLN
jgi:uncharacterized protein involved in type VI secretion and phage assembly